MPIPEMSHWRGKTFTLARNLQAPVPGMDGDIVAIKERRCSLEVTGGSSGEVKLQPGYGGRWLPYGPHRVTHAVLHNDEWVVSGPFSGCELAVGEHGGKVFVAHISRESEKRTEARRAFDEWDTSAVWGKEQISLPNDGKTDACYVFAWGTTKATLQLRRVDIHIESEGNNGRILDVVAIQLSPYRRRWSCPTCVIQ